MAVGDKFLSKNKNENILSSMGQLANGTLLGAIFRIFQKSQRSPNTLLISGTARASLDNDSKPALMVKNTSCQESFPSWLRSKMSIVQSGSLARFSIKPPDG